MDQAGLTSDVQTFSFFVESRGPYITVPDHWQVGQTISVSVQANSFSLGSVSIVVSDPQRRWPDVEQVYPASGDSFTTDFHWDGRFNGQAAAAGQYTVSVYASDVMSNLSVSHSQVTVPLVIPTAVPTLTATGTVAAAESTTAAAATATPQPSSTPTTAAGVPVTSFSSPASPVQQPAATLPSNVLWGGAAAAVIGAATAAALEAARKRKEEEEAQRKAAEAAAAQFNAAEKGIDAQIAANQDSQWLMQQWLGSQGLPTSYPTQAALVAAYEAAYEAEKQKAEAQNVTVDSGAGNEQNTTAAPTEEEIKQWYSDAYLKNAKKYIEPDQLTLEQWQELIKEFNDLQVHSGRDLYLISEPDLLSLAKPLPENTSKKQIESCAVNWNQAASLSDNDTLSFTKPEIVPLPNTDLIPSLAQQVLVDPIPQHNSDTWWGKVLGWVDNHQAFSSIAVGTAIGVSVALILLTAGAATPLIAAGWSAAISGAVIAGGTVGLNAYYGRDLGNRVIRNTLLGVLSSGLAGATTYFVASGGFMMAYLKTTNGIAAICAANPAACTNTEGMMKTADSIEKIGLGIKYTIQIAVGDQAGANETAIEIYSELLTGGVPGDTSYREIKEVIDRLGEDGAELIDKYGVEAVPLLYNYGEKAIDIIGAYGDDGIDLLLKYGDDVVDLIEDYQTPVVTMLVNSANPVTTIKNLNLLHTSLTSEAAELAIEQGEDAIGALSHWGAADLATYGDELVMRASSDADAIARATEIVNQVQSIEDLNSPEVASALQAIASDSTMTIGQSEHFVIGKYIDGLKDGYANEALVNGGEFYFTNPEVSRVIQSIQDNNLRKTVFDQINQYAVQPAMGIDMPFKLTTNGMEAEAIPSMKKAIAYLQKGELDQAFKLVKNQQGDFPAVYKEVMELFNTGYHYQYDEIEKAFIFTK